mgnify:CR=1 FL=1
MNMHIFSAFMECILKSSKIKELIENIMSLLPKNTEETRDDFKDNLKILLNDYLKKINRTTCEEFSEC